MMHRMAQHLNEEFDPRANAQFVLVAILCVMGTPFTNSMAK